jgi:hypothetical protein
MHHDEALPLELSGLMQHPDTLWTHFYDPVGCRFESCRAALAPGSSRRLDLASFV